MSSSSSEKEILHSKEPSQYSITPIFNQKPSKLMESNSMPNVSSEINPPFTFSDFELRTLMRNPSEPLAHEEEVSNRTWFPELKKTKSLLKGELEILKINMSINDALVPLKRSQMMKRMTMQVNYKRRKKYKFKNRASCLKICGIARTKDLVYEIESFKLNLSQNITLSESEAAKRDKTPWKFIRRGSALRREFINSTKLAFEIQLLLQSGFDHQLDSRFQNVQPVKITCPNCLFYITTTIKNVKTIRFKFISAISATVGCIFPDVFYTFRDTVHLCPLCKIYLGFCPTYHIRAKKSLSAIRLSLSKYIKKKENSARERKVKKASEENGILRVDIEYSKNSLIYIEIYNKKMVSASSTSAKNLFVESKLRLCDRVQVNVNNIAAITRQIQRGSKSNENLITAAKNFAIQEAAIENSETNLKKLKLLTTHINNQLDSLQNSSSKMEMVLEQVRSMQR